METKEEVVKIEKILDVELRGINLVFSDGYSRPAEGKETSYFKNHHPKAVKLSDGTYDIIRFFDYHRHSEYSLLDGCIRISDMIKKTKYIGAVTDHGNMYCALKWFKGMKKAGKIAVIGEEFYCETIDGDKKGNHLILLAKNNTGYKNLCKLSSMAFKNIYRKPHISYEMLKKYSEGIVCTSACLAGELSRIIMNEENMLSEKEIDEKLDKCVEALKSIFGEDYYIEIQNHHIDKEKLVNPRLVSLAKKHNVKVVAATDSHYTEEEDHEIHEVVLCVSTGKTMDDESRMKFDGDGYHLYSEDEADKRFSDIPEAVDNTLEIMEKCQYVEIETGKHYLPDFPLPDGFKNDMEYLKSVAKKGFEERFRSKFEILETDNEETKRKKTEEKQKYWDRWKYEMSVIENMGFSGYFLVVWDFLKFCRDNNIPVGAGRGCVNAGTLIYTNRGLIPIEDIKIGDSVYTHDGTLKPVLKTFKYPVNKNEELYHIRCFYGDSFGNAYTGNHKIFAVKAKKETDASKLASGNKYSDLINREPQWIEAKDLEVGDLVAFPKVDVDICGIEKYDLSNYINNNCNVLDDLIEEKCYGNRKDKMSLHRVSRETGLSRDAIKNFINNKASNTTEKIINKWLSENKFNVDDIRPQLNIKRYSKYLNLDEKTLYFLGYMTGNGWVRSKNQEVGVCFNSKNIKEDMLKYVFEKYGFQFIKQKSHNAEVVIYVCYSSVLKNFFLDFWKGYNFTAQTKVFPKEIFGLSENLKKAFINGLWDSDGSHKGKSKFSSTSFKLISDLKLLLSSLNIPNGMFFRPKHYTENCNGKNSGDSWQITVPHNFSKITRKCGESSDNYILKRIYKIENEKSDYVYDISVKDNHSYLTSNFVAHNSGAGSLVLYCLHITDFDPIKYDLLFERFLNPDRISLPD